jgi:hypothetical protein
MTHHIYWSRDAAPFAAQESTVTPSAYLGYTPQVNFQPQVQKAEIYGAAEHCGLRRRMTVMETSRAMNVTFQLAQLSDRLLDTLFSAVSDDGSFTPGESGTVAGWLLIKGYDQSACTGDDPVYTVLMYGRLSIDSAQFAGEPVGVDVLFEEMYSSKAAGTAPNL